MFMLEPSIIDQILAVSFLLSILFFTFFGGCVIAGSTSGGRPLKRETVAAVALICALPVIGGVVLTWYIFLSVLIS